MMHIIVEGPPVGKARPRLGRNGNVYTPQATASAEREIAALARLEAKEPLVGPLRLKVSAYYPIPESWPKKRKGEAVADVVRPTVKPDLDNVVKLVMDALKNIAWRDDAQVVEIHADRWYAANPGVEIEVGLMNGAG